MTAKLPCWWTLEFNFERHTREENIKIKRRHNDCQFYRPRKHEKQETKILTTLVWILIRVVTAVVLAVTLPTQGFTESVVALELILGAVSAH